MNILYQKFQKSCLTNSILFEIRTYIFICLEFLKGNILSVNLSINKKMYLNSKINSGDMYVHIHITLSKLPTNRSANKDISLATSTKQLLIFRLE